MTTGLALSKGGTDIVDDTRVLMTVCTWERHALRQLYSPIASDLNLHAVRVKLGTSARIDRVGDLAFV